MNERFEMKEKKFEKLSEKEKLKRLWATLFIRAAEEKFDDVEREKDDPDTILEKVNLKLDEFRKWLKESKFKWAVHGKKFSLAQKDIDVKFSLWLLKKAGLNIEDLVEVPIGEEAKENRINIDFGGIFGIKIPSSKEVKTNKTVIIDHHPKMTKVDEELNLTEEDYQLLLKTSASQMIFEGLDSLGLFKEEEREAISKMIEFITFMDNKNYPSQHNLKTFKESWQTVLGLYQYISPDKLLEYFKKGKKPTEILSKEEMKELGLIYKNKKTGEIIDKSKERKEMIEKALKMIKKLEKNGFVVETKNGLKFLVDYLNERRKEGIPLRVDAVFASGYDGVIVYDENKESYFINLHPELPHQLRVKIEGGINVRGKMFIRDASDKEPLKVSLKKILEAVGVDFSKLTDNLKKAIEKNEEWMKILIFDASQIEKVDDEWRLGNGVIENLPQNFLPQKGTKIYLRKIDKREKNKYFLKVVKIEEKKAEKVLKFVVPINRKNGSWEAELPNGLKVKLPEGEYNPNHFYQIVIKFNPDGKNEILEISKRGKIK